MASVASYSLLKGPFNIGHSFILQVKQTFMIQGHVLLKFSRRKLKSEINLRCRATGEPCPETLGTAPTLTATRKARDDIGSQRSE